MTKKARIGRPPKSKGEKKRHIIAFKLDDAELGSLRRKAKALGLSMSETIRKAIEKLTKGKA